jgi:spermidine synthase
VAGSVYAVSTVGSVAGTLLLGFFLLPEFGTRTIVFTLSLVLGALAVLAAWRTGTAATPLRSIGPLLALAIVIGAGVGSGATLAREPVPGFVVQSEAESLYGWVRVIDHTRQGHRILFSDASVLSAVDLATDRSLLGYQQVLELLPAILPHPSRALVIGLGGGHVARTLKAQGIPTDTIEIDPAVAEAARRWFHFEPTGQFLVGDARYEIKKLSTHYDLIIHDCFTGGAEPTHLLSQEMLSELRALLNDHGILALNYVGFTQGEGSDAVEAVHRTLREVFPWVRTFVTDKNEFTDFILLASLEPLTIDPLTGDRRLKWLLDHEHRFAEGSGFVLTDDYNPMESRQVRKAETYRRYFLERVAFELLIR